MIQRILIKATFFAGFMAWGAITLHAQLVTTYAGNQIQGSTNDTGLAASFNWPVSVAIDQQHNIYVADAQNNMIRKITPSNSVTTFAGASLPGITNDTGSKARFNHPLGVAVDKSGNIYVGDAKNNSIRKITSSGVVSLVAGSGLLGSANGPGATATFNYPNGVAVDDSGYVYVADALNNMIRKITPAGVVSTFAGSTTSGSNDGVGTAASFNYPTGIAIDANRNLYVTDENNHLIRKITPAGLVTTYAGTGASGSVDDTGTAASFFAPYGITIDASNNLYVAEIGNDIIRKITASKQVMTFAGYPGLVGANDGIKFDATFNNPTGVALDGLGNLFVGDWNNNLIRKIDMAYTGIFSINKLGKVAVYPNPATDQLTVPTQNQDRVTILNVMGAKVYEAVASQNVTRVSLKDLPSGNYLLQLVTKDGERGYGKFIKE